MRLGGPVFYRGNNPEEFALAHVKKGYRAAYCPEGLTCEDTEQIQAYREALERHGILPAEVGAWCNPLSMNLTEARESIAYIKKRLRLADLLGAKTCVNILGTKYIGNWYGPSGACYKPYFFKEAVALAREIVDEVKPAHTKLSFEIMPYCFLDSPEEYLRFLEAVDRKEVGIHFDPCNCIESPRRYYDNRTFLKHAFSLLGEGILSIHLKDIRIVPDSLTVAFEEVLIGEGFLRYATLMQEIAKLPADTPAMLEHLSGEEEYDKAAAAVRYFARTAGMEL